eukprot:1108732-Alexandrium_andersonii.AAC.1
MSASLVGSEMCIRDRLSSAARGLSASHFPSRIQGVGQMDWQTNAGTRVDADASADASAQLNADRVANGSARADADKDTDASKNAHANTADHGR